MQASFSSGVKYFLQAAHSTSKQSKKIAHLQVREKNTVFIETVHDTFTFRTSVLYLSIASIATPKFSITGKTGNDLKAHLSHYAIT